MDNHRYSEILDRKSIPEIWITRRENCGQYRLVLDKWDHNSSEDYIEQVFLWKEYSVMSSFTPL